MKFTNSADGIKRANITIKHRIGYNELVNFVCYTITMQGPPFRDEGGVQLLHSSKLTFKNRASFLRQYKKAMAEHSRDTIDYWSDEFNSDVETPQMLRDHARGVVDKLFPELIQLSEGALSEKELNAVKEILQRNDL